MNGDAARLLENLTDADAAMNAQLAKVKNLRGGIDPVVIEAGRETALLTAYASRAQALRGHLASTELHISVAHGIGVLQSATHALEETDRSTRRLADATERLVIATWVLAGAAIVAALIGAYVAITVPPEIIPIAAPSAPVVVLPH